MGVKINIIIISLVLLTTSLIAAQEFSIDISGLDNKEYNLGETLTFKIILLEGETQTDKQVVKAMTPYFTQHYAYPATDYGHSMGMKSRQALEQGSSPKVRGASS